MSELIITIGEGFQATLDRAAEAERAWKAGEITTDAPTHVIFESFADLSRLLTVKRLEVLRHVHRNPTASVRALAETLGRPYANVHADVAALIEAGLIERHEDGLHAEYDNITAKIAL